MEGAPDCSCENPLYSMGKDDETEAYGEVTEETVRVAQAHEARAELPEIDDDDAEVMHGWIQQLASERTKKVLWAAFVWRRPTEGYGAAMRALMALIAANRATVSEMRRRGA